MPLPIVLKTSYNSRLIVSILSLAMLINIFRPADDREQKIIMRSRIFNFNCTSLSLIFPNFLYNECDQMNHYGYFLICSFGEHLLGHYAANPSALHVLALHRACPVNEDAKEHNYLV